MTNSQSSFNHIAEAINKTEAALAVYDSLLSRAAIAPETVTALEAEIAALHRNDARLDAKARGSKYAAANSALSLAQGDLKSVQDSLEAQKALTAATGKAAAKLLFDVRDALRIHRRNNVAAR